MGRRRILTVIPARGGSKGLPGKNLRPLCGRPLIYYPIRAAQQTPGLERIVVSTEDRRIAATARELGAEVPFLRPPELAQDLVTLIHVVKHALEFFDARGEHYDAVLSLQATVPLITSATIEAALEKFHATGCLAVATVSPITHGHPYLSKRLTGPQGDELEDFVPVPPGTPLYPRQRRETAYYCNGALFLRDRRLLQELDPATNCLGDRPRAVVMPEEESVNIDSLLDFKLAELLMRERLARSPRTPLAATGR